MNKKETYKELLKNPRWIKRRNEILTRDKNTCQFCGKSDRYLHVHHKRYEKGKKPWEYDDADLICICEKCHENITEDSRDLYEEFLYARDCLREYGFSDAILKTLLSRIGWQIESIRTCEYNDFNKAQWVEDALSDVVFGTQYYEDIKTLAKLGIKSQFLIDSQFPMFKNDYASIEKDERIVKSEDDYKMWEEKNNETI